jgi:hypothetical protein
VCCALELKMTTTAVKIRVARYLLTPLFFEQQYIFICIYKYFLLGPPIIKLALARF